MDFKFVNPVEAYQLLKQHEAILLDIRKSFEREMRAVDVEEFLAIPLTEIAEKIAILPHHRMILILDSVGLKSREAFEIMKRYGFEKIAIITGGIVEWEKDGLPVLKNPDFNYGGQCLCQVKPRPKK